MKQGQSYPISLQSAGEYGGTTQEQAYGVWIDYNDDEDFDDAGEFVYSSPRLERSSPRLERSSPAPS